MISSSLPPYGPITDFIKHANSGDDAGVATVHSMVVLIFMLACAYTVMAAVQGNEGMTGPHGGTVKTACNKCHTPGQWKPIKPAPDFDHGSTGFPLKEMHAGVYCRVCHSSLVFSDIGNQCSDCHADIHRRQLGEDCEDCHSIRGWDEIRSTVDGHRNRFPLLGAHAALQCESCHTSAAVGLFRGLRTDCDACHHSDYVGAKTIDHQEAGFALQCELCHSMDSWSSGFDHIAFTGFDLTGAHAALDCLDCHTNANFTGDRADCASCHLADYNATTDPNHASETYPLDCALCHSTVSWIDFGSGSALDHNQTQFPLTGAHRTLACRDCHSNGQYSSLSTDCYACHADLYNTWTDPNHAAAGFSHDCLQCHMTSRWTNPTYAHEVFPIYSGRHANTWSSCSICHTNSDNYSVFTCFSCHSKADMDSRHRDVSGYVYNNASCYSCHPSDRADD